MSARVLPEEGAQLLCWGVATSGSRGDRRRGDVHLEIGLTVKPALPSGLRVPVSHSVPRLLSLCQSHFSPCAYTSRPVQSPGTACLTHGNPPVGSLPRPSFQAAATPPTPGTPVFEISAHWLPRHSTRSGGGGPQRRLEQDISVVLTSKLGPQEHKWEASPRTSGIRAPAWPPHWGTETSPPHSAGSKRQNLKL